MQDDDLNRMIKGMSGEIPKPRLDLSEAEKDALIKQVGGPRTTAAIIKAKDEVPMARIPFLFSSLDSQAILDILANDMTGALVRARAKKAK